ncbi:uncharacterized protein LODBEIA_P45930 [Lodderomyces beijingensis]|uniref:Calcineurin-like phosphoesterase domain-containing protein n=1 Tax=Lodderomyces beijingensis TaxID=1775926 RepID=A0ABP0ZR31_9ASCO
MLLPRRLLRVSGYGIFFLVLTATLLLFANKHQIIELNQYVPFDYFSSAAPSFFQPPSNSFIVDIAIKDCYAYNYGNSNCGKPEADYGKFGDLTSYGGGWVRIKKDLTLGKSWYHKEMLSLKEIDHDEFQRLLRNKIVDDTVIVDFAVSDPKSDVAVEGGKGKLPSRILESIRNQQDQKAHNIAVAEEERKEEERQQEEKEEEKEEGKKEKEKEKENENEKFSKRASQTPSLEEVARLGWVQKPNGIWVKYGSHDDKDAINAVDLLFGPEATDPRPNWQLIKAPLKGIAVPSDLPAFLTFRRGPKLDYKKEYNKPLKLNENSEFKILQVADLHFSTGYGKCLDPVPAESAKGCKADSRTLQFIDQVLDIEKPDLVVLTGDQIMGDVSPDSESSAFKALSPFIERGIPFAVVLGNHDAEGSLKSKEIMGLYADLPYSVAAIGPEEIDGFGNYVVTVQGKSKSSVALSFYFVDSHAYSPNPKVYPGYDWIKESQLIYMKEEAASLVDGVRKFEKESVFDGTASKNQKHLSMAFFHIPVPEYKNLKESYVGEHREGITAPRYDTGARDIFQELGVSAISIGHDHCNDYCLLDQKQTSEENKIWLCYGGGVGLGGYGGYGGYVRRLRTFQLDTSKGEIKTWKRAESDPGKKLDEQILVTGGNVVNW